MERWKQRNSLNLDTRAGISYLSKIFGAGNHNVTPKDSIFQSESHVGNPTKPRHYAGLQPLSPCWELSDSFTHSQATSKVSKEERHQGARMRQKYYQENTPKRPYSICGPITSSHYPNFSVPSPSQAKNKDFLITPLVQLRQKKGNLQYRCNICLSQLYCKSCDLTLTLSNQTIILFLFFCCCRQDNGHHHGSNSTNSEVNGTLTSALGTSNNGIALPNSGSGRSQSLFKGSVATTSEGAASHPPAPPHRVFASEVRGLPTVPSINSCHTR